MFLAIRKRLDSNKEGGFTLIELMVVVLIIAILIAIAIPTFLGARKRAQDRAAQSSLRNAFTSAKVIFTDAETYASADAAALLVAEPSLTFSDDVASTGPKNVSVKSSGTGQWGAAALSASGTCFYIHDTATGPGTQYGTSAVAADCTGTKALLAAGPNW